MPYPFHILENEKIHAPAQDVETFIRHALGQHLFIVEKGTLDETNKRFNLYFYHRHLGLDPYMEDGKIGKICWGGAEVVEWSNSTEIIRMWAITPEDWYIGEFLLDRDKVMEERFGWLEELSHEIRQQFMQPISIHKEDMTLGDLEYLMEHGDKDAIEYWEKELQPEIIELCDALVVLINKTFDNDPAKPFFELLKSMSLSKNPLHRAIVKPYSDWTLNRVREQGAKLLTDELSKSSNQLPEQDISQSKHETNVGSISVGNNVEGSMIIKGDGNTVVMNAPVSKKRKS